jgi:integrase
MISTTARFDLADHPTLGSITDSKQPLQVTPDSLWTDDDWRLPGWVPGILNSSFVVRFDVDADEKTISGLKWLTALLFVGRHGQTVYHPSTAGPYSSGIRHMARFMKQRNFRSFAQLDRNAFEEFVEDIHVKLVDPREEAITAPGDSDEELGALLKADGVEPFDRAMNDPDATGGVAKAYNRLRIWKLLWDHRDTMREAGIQPLKFNPFSKTSPSTLAKYHATVAADEIPALPDEVALPLLAGAQRLIDQPAQNVIELQRRYLSTMARMDREPPTEERLKLRTVMEEFEFSILDGEHSPWHAPIRLMAGEIGGGEALRDLIETIRDACLVVIMGYTGLRISEAVSITVEPRLLLRDELPSCISREASKSGLAHHYMLHGLLSKGQERPIPEEWLMGARPMSGASREPATVRAVRVLEALYDPWRRFAADEHTKRQLFVGFAGSGLPRRRTSVIPITSQTLRFGLKALVADQRYVDLSGLEEAALTKEELRPYLATPDSKVAAGIRPHQWRKTFMRYAMRTDPKMAPAVSQHFKHLTVAMTERDYGPKDIKFLEESDSIRARATGSFLRRMVEGTTRPISRLDKAFELSSQQWRAMLPDDAPQDDDAFTKLAIDQDLRIWFAEHGRCLVALHPDEARCHDRAGTPGWRHARPNMLTRTPSLCTGCKNFSVHEDTAAFWRRRYVEHQRAYLSSGGDLSFEIIRRRAEQAGAYLRALGEELPEIGEQGEAA